MLQALSLYEQGVGVFLPSSTSAATSQMPSVNEMREKAAVIARLVETYRGHLHYNQIVEVVDEVSCLESVTFEKALEEAKANATLESQLPRIAGTFLSKKLRMIRAKLHRQNPIADFLKSQVQTSRLNSTREMAEKRSEGARIAFEKLHSDSAGNER